MTRIMPCYKLHALDDERDDKLQKENAMKVCKTLLFAIFACTAAGSVNSAPKADHPDTAHQVQIDLLKSKNSAPLIWESGTQVAQSLPDCGTMDGQYCSTPTARARCYWYQYQEPMVCVCQPNNVWFCN